MMAEPKRLKWSVKNISVKNSYDFLLYPNPTDGRENIFLKIPNPNDETYSILINDLLGRDFVSDLTSIKLDGETLIIIGFEGKLPTGVYLINVVIKDEIITKKLIVKWGFL